MPLPWRERRSTDVPVSRILTGHFLKRFLDNDLLSPSGDGHEHAALVFSVLLAIGLWGSFSIVLKSLSPFLSPFGLLLSALNDKYAGIAVSMIVTALAAVIEWQALVLDQRDWRVLGPLPISARVLLQAKVQALALFVGIFAIALAGLPGVLYPPLQAASLGGGLGSIVWMTAVHLAVSLAACLFSFLAVLAFRETTRVILGPRLFRGLSPGFQFAAVLALTVALLIVATAQVNVPAAVDRARGVNATVYRSPPMWFVGLYETLTLPVVKAAPTSAPAGTRQFWTLAGNQRDRDRYLGAAEAFWHLARFAVAGLSVLGIIVLGAAAFNRQTIGQDAARPPLARALRSRAVGLLTPGRATHPVSEAAFFFTLQTLARSAGHRAYLAGCLAVGVAIVIWTAGAGEPIAPAGGSVVPADRFLALQMILVFCLLSGLRWVFLIPAELRANWMFRFAWDGDARHYFAGVRRAVHLGTVLPLLVALAPFHARFWGVRLAIGHLVIGWLASSALVNLWMVRLAKLPFTCSYSPKGTLRTRWPWYVLAFLASTFGFARIEHLALGSLPRLAALVGTLCVLLGLIALYRKSSAWHPPMIVFDDPPECATQRLGLASGE